MSIKIFYKYIQAQNSWKTEISRNKFQMDAFSTIIKKIKFQTYDLVFYYQTLDFIYSQTAK